ncbi:hypothetical protein Droror1_Dr00009240 [Drosera rotundifolia]
MHQKMSSPTKISVISIIIHVLLQRREADALSLLQNVTVPAISFFGDSVVDPGNSDWILLVCRAGSYPPPGDSAMRKSHPAMLCKNSGLRNCFRLSSIYHREQKISSPESASRSLALAMNPCDITNLPSANIDGPASTLQRVATEGENGSRWEKGIAYDI